MMAMLQIFGDIQNRIKPLQLKHPFTRIKINDERI